jgi:death on curing protein
VIEPTFPPIQAILDLHAELIAEHGGAPGLRDMGLLESALARPRQLLAYGREELTIFDLAAALAVALTSNHPFIDGNKRVAFSGLFAMLKVNGHYLDVSEVEAEQVVRALSAHEMSEAEFARWVAANCHPD